jgi:PAS domain S-box-containing protein
MNSLLARLLLIVSLALVPALGFQAYTESQARHARQQLVEDEAMRLMGLVASEQRRIAEGAEQVLDVIAGSPAVQNDRPDDCQQLLGNVVASLARYVTVAVVGSDGHVVCAPRAVDRGIDVSDRDYFHTAMQSGGFTIGGYEVSRGTGRPTVHMAKPFRRPGGDIAGVVVLALDLGWLQEQLDQVALPPGTVVSILDRNGTFVARRPNGEHFIGQPMRAEYRFILTGNADKVVPMTSLEGRPIIVGTSRPGSGPNGWAVGVGLDPDLAFAGVAKANRTGMLLIVAGAGLALATTCLAGTQLIRRPLDRLLRVAESWRNGDLAARVGLCADNSEFGRLAGAFDAMAVELEERECALRHSEALFRTTFDQAGVGMTQAALDGTWLRVNDRICAILGYPRNELVGHNFQDLTHPDDLEADLAQRGSLLRGEIATITREKRYLRKDGGPVWAAVTVSLLSDTGDRPERIITIVQDISERKRAEEALNRATALLRAIGDCSPDPIYAKDADGRFLFANPAVLAVIGKPAGQVIGHSDAEWHHDPAQAAAVMANDRRVIASGRVERCEETFEAAGAGTRVFRSAKAPLRMEDGTVVGLVAVSSDITQLKDAETALRESEERFRATFEQAAVGIVHIDLAGKWLRVNDRLCDMLGYSRAELLAITFREITHPDDLPASLASFRRLMSGEIAAFNMDKRYLRKDGTLLWASLTDSLVRDQTGTPMYGVGVIEDISERKRVEARLRRLTADLETRVHEAVAAREAAQTRAAHAERMQALGQLAGGIAHDFNNVLQGVQGAAALIERRAGDEAGVRRLARLAIEAIERGSSITRRLLAFGRRSDLRAEAVDVTALLGDLREMLAPTLGASIDVRVGLEAGVPPLFADKGQLETALVNLATNARDAMPEGGCLTLSAETETVPADGPTHAAGLAPGRYVRLAVADTGKGMDRTTLAHAGEPFFTTKEPGAGTGLGLPMAKGFIEQSGGTLRIESSLGKGTTITLWLPAAETNRARAAAKDAAGIAAKPDRPATAARRVLLVDDENVVREVLAEQLEDAGYSVLVAASGTEALALLAAGEAVDALVTDLTMPGMGGLEVIRAAQQRHPGLPAVLLTGYAGDGAALAVGGAISGSFSLLRKPVSGVHLADRVRALLAAAVDDKAARNPDKPAPR